MSIAEGVVVVVGVALAAVVIGYFVFSRQHPENADRHEPYDADTASDATGRGTLPGKVNERPAGPDAEGQAVDGRGDVAPGPSPGPPA